MSVIIRLQNLPWSANAGDIRRFFQGLSIPDGGVHIVGGEDGDAFIAFSTDEDARQAMHMNNKLINNMQVKLFLSSKSEMQSVIAGARESTVGSSGGLSAAQSVNAEYPSVQTTTSSWPPRSNLPGPGSAAHMPQFPGPPPPFKPDLFQPPPSLFKVPGSAFGAESTQMSKRPFTDESFPSPPAMPAMGLPNSSSPQTSYASSVDTLSKMPPPGQAFRPPVSSGNSTTRDRSPVNDETRRPPLMKGDRFSGPYRHEQMNIAPDQRFPSQMKPTTERQYPTKQPLSSTHETSDFESAKPPDITPHSRPSPMGRPSTRFSDAPSSVSVGQRPNPEDVYASRAKKEIDVGSSYGDKHREQYQEYGHRTTPVQGLERMNVGRGLTPDRQEAPGRLQRDVGRRDAEYRSFSSVDEVSDDHMMSKQPADYSEQFDVDNRALGGQGFPGFRGRGRGQMSRGSFDSRGEGRHGSGPDYGKDQYPGSGNLAGRGMRGISPGRRPVRGSVMRGRGRGGGLAERNYYEDSLDYGLESRGEYEQHRAPENSERESEYAGQETKDPNLPAFPERIRGRGALRGFRGGQGRFSVPERPHGSEPFPGMRDQTESLYKGPSFLQKEEPFKKDESPSSSSYPDSGPKPPYPGVMSRPGYPPRLSDSRNGQRRNFTSNEQDYHDKRDYDVRDSRPGLQGQHARGNGHPGRPDFPPSKPSYSEDQTSRPPRSDMRRHFEQLQQHSSVPSRNEPPWAREKRSFEDKTRPGAISSDERNRRPTPDRNKGNDGPGAVRDVQLRSGQPPRSGLNRPPHFDSPGHQSSPVPRSRTYPQNVTGDSVSRPSPAQDRSITQDQPPPKSPESTRKRPREQNLCVYVTGLPRDASVRDVRQFFHNCEIPWTGIKLITDRQGTRTGEAYIQFANEQTALEGKKRNGNFMGRSKVRVETCTAAKFEEALDSHTQNKQSPQVTPEPPKRVKTETKSLEDKKSSEDSKKVITCAPQQKQSENVCLAVGNLPPHAEEKDIRDFFHPVKVKNVFLNYDRNGKTMESGYVEFNVVADSERAVKLSGKEMKGNKIEVQVIQQNKEETKINKEQPSKTPAQAQPSQAPKPEERKVLAADPAASSPQNKKEQQNKNQRPVDSSDNNTRDSRTQNRDKSNDNKEHTRDNKANVKDSTDRNREHRSSRDSNPLVVKLEGIPYAADETAVRHFFRGISILPKGIHFLTREDGRPTGSAFVQFASHRDRGRVMDRNRGYMGRRFILIKIISEEEMERDLRPRGQRRDPVSRNPREDAPKRSDEPSNTNVPSIFDLPEVTPTDSNQRQRPDSNRMRPESELQSHLPESLPMRGPGQEDLRQMPGLIGEGPPHLSLARGRGRGLIGPPPDSEEEVMIERPYGRMPARRRPMQPPDDRGLIDPGAEEYEYMETAEDPHMHDMHRDMLRGHPRHDEGFHGRRQAGRMDEMHGPPRGPLLKQPLLGEHPQAEHFVAEEPHEDMEYEEENVQFYPPDHPGPPPPSRRPPPRGPAGEPGRGPLPRGPSRNEGWFPVAMKRAPPKVTLEDILEFLLPHKAIPDSVKVRYNADGTPTGDVLVAFSTPQEAMRAIEERNMKPLLGRPVELFRPKPNM